ncbi:MAG: lysylphosphatidylglycerol synthase transmembrane domain-containing protein, partial [Anaerolineae bacterium]
MSFLKGARRWLPGALISGAIIVAILYFVDFKATWATLRTANYIILALVMMLSLVWMAVRAQVWRTLLRDRATYGAVFFTIGEGYLLNNFLPFRLGELGRAFLLSRKSDLQFSEILPTIVVERSLDLGFSAAVLLLSLPFVVGARGSEKIGLMVGAAVLLGLLLLYLLARNQAVALRLFHSLTAHWPALQRLGGGFLESFLNGLGILTNGRLFLRFLFWMTINWGLSILSYYLMIRAFFPQAQWVWGMFGLGAAAFG